MIRRILNELQTMKTQNRFSWRQLCIQVPYATLMRWRHRQRHKLPLYLPPGPKKSVPLDWAEFYPLLRQLKHGRARTLGTTALYQRFAASISRRQFKALVRSLRQHQLDTMKHIQWLWPGLAWSLDATQYGKDGCQIVPVQDLASRYRLPPLVTDRLEGYRIAEHLEQLFKQYGPPLFLKRDNGSPFNNEHVDGVMSRYGVLPLNNPPAFPRYNGAMEKSIRDLKCALDKRLAPSVPPECSTVIETTVHELNHRRRRCLKGRTACAVFHDEAQHLRWTKRQRQTIFRLLLQRFGAMIEKTAKGHHHRPATLWRLAVESWLRCQGLIVIRQNKNVSTNFPENWSHN